MEKVKPGVVKVVQVGYKLDETAQALPAVRMVLGYGFSCFFMIMAVASKVAHVQCLFVVATMVTLFVLEPIQYQCSCMLPLFLFPISRLLVAHKLFGVYMNDEILRSISSVLIGLIALKSPLSRRLCLWFLCITGVRVSRVLLSVMLLVFLVSMLVDATMTTGILAGFVDPLIFEIYANNLRIRYAEHVRSGLKEADATLTEVDFVFKDPAKQRRAVAGEARMNDTVEEMTQEAEPMFAVDEEGNIREMVMVMDRDQGQGQNPPDLSSIVAENPEMRREQVSEALRSFGIDLQKMGLKLELQDTTTDAKSMKTMDYKSAFTNVSGAEEKLQLDCDNRGSESHFSMTAQRSEPIGKSDGGAKRSYIDGSKVNGKREGKSRMSAATTTKTKRSARSNEDLTERSGSSDSVSSNSFMTPRGPASPPSEYDATMGRQQKSGQRRDGQKLATAAYGKRGASKTSGSPSSKAPKGGRFISQGSTDGGKRKKGSASTSDELKPEKSGDDKDMAEDNGAVPFQAGSHSIQETKSFSKDASPAVSTPQHVQFSRVIYRAPPVMATSGGAADKGERQTLYQQRRPVRASQGMRRDENDSQWSTVAMIGTSTCNSEEIVSEAHSSVRHYQTDEERGVAENAFNGPNRKDFVLDFSGHLSGSQRRRSQRRKDVLKSKRMLLRRKRKSMDLRKENTPFESEACAPPLLDHLAGDTNEEARRPPRRKAWVDRVDDMSRHNPLLATDVSFRLRRSWSKPRFLWPMSRFFADRGDSLRNLLFGRHEQVVVAETSHPDKGEPENARKHHEGSSSENKEKSSKDGSDDSHDNQNEPSRKAQGSEAVDDDDQPAENAAGKGVRAQVPKSHEHGGGARELETIIMEEKEKAKELRAAVLLALTYGASFGAAAAYGASNANVHFKKYIEMNVELPSASLNLHTWLLVHVPFCFALMIIAARIIYYVHTRNYDIIEAATAPKSDVVIRDRLHIMGHVSYGEYIAAFLVGTAMVMLIFREPTFMENGWGNFFGIEREVTDASVGIIVGILAFLFPADILPEAHQTQIIEWADMLKRLPWGVIFILGSSSTITTAIENNGVYKMLEEKLLNLALPPFYHQYISVLIMGCFGELTTFKSRLRYFTRIGYRISRKLKRDPLFFLLPVSVVCQLSLILPSASPNNAMAFELGSMTSLQMIVPGFITKALTIMLYMTLINYTVSPTELSEVHAIANHTSGLAPGDQDATAVAIDVAQVVFD